VRIITLFISVFMGDAALAASQGGSIGLSRLDFANTPAFHGVFESRVARSLGAESGSGVSAKMRIAMWTSASMLPARPETLVAIQPSALPGVEALQPSETIIAETVRSASLGERPPTHQLAKRERFKRRVFLDPSEIEDDGPSVLEYQRHALSNRADLDDAEPAGGDAQPVFLGRPEHTKRSDVEEDAQPSVLWRIFGALFSG
jgi:hypothetical protein